MDRCHDVSKVRTSYQLIIGVKREEAAWERYQANFVIGDHDIGFVEVADRAKRHGVGGDNRRANRNRGFEFRSSLG